MRTTADAVKKVLAAGGDYDAAREPELAPYIRAANLIVSRVNECATQYGETLTSSELRELEAWVAAHCYMCSDQGYTSRNTEGASGQFQGRTDMHLDGTKYGQLAQTLDVSGCLTALGKQQRAFGAWLGRPPSEQTDYVDRD